MLKPVAPAFLQGEREFGWGPGFPIVAFRRLSITAYIIFSSLRIINSLRSVDTLPISRPALALPLTCVSHSLFLGEPFARWLPQLITCVCLLTRCLAPFAESEDMSLHRCQFLIPDGDAGAHHSSPGSPLGLLGLNQRVCLPSINIKISVWEPYGNTDWYEYINEGKKKLHGHSRNACQALGPGANVCYISLPLAVAKVT